MPCYEPLKGFRSLERNPATGKHLITFNPLKALNSTNPMTIPCGRCTGCRLERSRQWAVRCMHEAQLYPRNAFITLTFNNESLPEDYSVHVRTLQLFIKKLRKSLPQKIRTFACGEYGDLNLRPHYHALIFNHDFDDKKYFNQTKQGEILYTSDSLTDLWSYGHCTTGAVTFESAAYTARYIMKKYTGDKADEHYTRQHPLTKAFHRVEPEFVTMSRRPGIGAPWLERYKADVYPADKVIARGMVMNPPRFYDQSLTEEELDQVKRRRQRAGLRYSWDNTGELHRPSMRPDNTPERLRVRKAVKEAQLTHLKRTL